MCVCPAILMFIYYSVGVLCVCVRLHVSAFRNVSFPNLVGTLYGSSHAWSGLYMFVYMQRVRVRAKHSHVCVHLLLDGLYTNLLGTYCESPHVICAMYFSCSSTALVCERACVIAQVAKRSLIFGWILSKFAENILRITTSLHGLRTTYYVLIHSPRASSRACAWVSFRSSLDGSSPNVVTYTTGEHV
jgi:hypothetical protein